MGQYWNLFNADKRQKGSKVRGKFDEFIFTGHDWLVKLLARPEYSSSIRYLYLTLPTGDRDELGSFLNLPAELHAAIFAFIPSLDDAVCLTVTHRALISEGYRRVSQLYREEYAHWGSWAGDRIITAGDYIDELPENMLTPWEEAEMVMEGARFYNFAYHHYQHHSLMVLKSIARIRPNGSGDHLRLSLLLQHTAPRYASRGTWALCNVSRKEYICASALTTLELSHRWQTGCSLDGPFVRGENTVIDLGTLALIVTCWSDDLGDVGGAGPWAGDRLAIAVVEDLGDEGWADVSVMGLRLVKHCVKVNERHLCTSDVIEPA